MIPKRNPSVIKYHYHLSTPEGLNKDFKKFVYASSSNESKDTVVIHYLGDASVAKNFPHGTGNVS
jgi:hypothetical protein